MNALMARASSRRAEKPAHDLAVARALGWIELRRLALNPFVAVGFALSGIAFYTVVGLQGGQLFNYDAFFGVLVFPLAGMTLIATNLAVQRGRRDDLEELFESLPASRATRTIAHAISLLAPATYAVVLAVAATVIQRAAGGIGWPHPTEIGTGAVLVVCAGLVGILLALILPRSGVSPFLVVGIGFLEGAMASSHRWQWSRLAPFMPIPDEPPELWFRPRGAHLVYLVGIAAVLLSVALLIHRRTLRVVGALVLSFVVVVAAAVAQSPLPTPADEARFAAWVEHPERAQQCRNAGHVTYCAYNAYQEVIPRWQQPVTGVLSLVPSTVYARTLTIRQRVPSGVVQNLRPATRAALSFRVSPAEPFWWPDDGAIHPDLNWCSARSAWGRCEIILGNMVASWAVGLPLVRTGPPFGERVDGETRVPPDVLLNTGLYDSSGEARAVVALWLTLEATPRTRAETPMDVGDRLTRYPINTCSWLSEGPEPAVSWSLVDSGYARRLAELPVQDVAARLRTMWDEVTDPHTTTAQLASMFHLERPTNGMLKALASNQGC